MFVARSLCPSLVDVVVLVVVVVVEVVVSLTYHNNNLYYNHGRGTSNNQTGLLVYDLDPLHTYIDHTVYRHKHMLHKLSLFIYYLYKCTAQVEYCINYSIE